jgi:hypothetical protein
MVNLIMTLVLGLLPYHVIAQSYPHATCLSGYYWVDWHKHLWRCH